MDERIDPPVRILDLVFLEDEVATIAQLGRQPLSYWLWVVPGIILGSLLVGIPTAVIPNPIFTRMIPTSPSDYGFWAITSILLGLLAASYFVHPREVVDPAQNQLVGGGLLSVLAVGCPICNKIVVLALGVSGALTYFAPIQPAIGLASVALLIYALRLRFQALNGSCPIAPGG